jgi:hypothetical protein
MHIGVRFLVEIAIGRLGIGLSDRLNSVSWLTPGTFDCWASIHIEELDIGD